jgi:hypothetical protein
VLEKRVAWSATLRGRVLDEHGTGVAGATVTWRSQEKDEASVKSAPDGSFVIDATRWAEPSAVWLRAQAEGWFAQNYVPVRWEESPVPPVDLVLGRPRRIRGRLVDASTREPIAGGWLTAVDLTAQSQREWPTGAARSGSDGTFEIVAPAGNWRICSSATDYLQGPEVTVRVPEGGDGDVGDVALAAWGAVEGTILTATPWAAGRVMVVMTRPGERPSPKNFGTDQLGWFRVAGLAEGTWDVYGVETSAVTWGFDQTLVHAERLGTVEVAPRAVVRFDARMPEPAILTIAAAAPPSPATAVAKGRPSQVRDDADDHDAMPVDESAASPEMEVTIESLDGSGLARNERDDKSFASRATWPWRSTRLDTELSVPNLPAGRYRVTFRCKGAAEPVERVVQLAAGEKQRLFLDVGR